MATWRQRGGGSWEFIVKRKGLLPKPLYLSFDSEKEGIAYCAKLEALLDKGIIPPEFAVRSVGTLDQLVETWEREAHMSDTDRAMIPALTTRVKGVNLSAVDYAWCGARFDLVFEIAGKVGLAKNPSATDLARRNVAFSNKATDEAGAGL